MANSYSEIGTSSGSGTGDVVGPSSVAADQNIAIFDGTTGKILMDSEVDISDIAVQSDLTNLCARSGATTNAHVAIWSGTNSATLVDGGTLPVSTGGSTKLLLWQQNAAITLNTAYQDIPNVVNQNITFADSGTYVFVVYARNWYPSNTCVLQFAVLVGDTVVAETQTQNITLDNNGPRSIPIILPALSSVITAGTSGVRIQAKLISGNPPAFDGTTNYSLTCTLCAAGL